jgi:hypothetical protein
MTNDDRQYLTAMCASAVKAAGLLNNPRATYTAYAERLEQYFQGDEQAQALCCLSQVLGVHDTELCRKCREEAVIQPYNCKLESSIDVTN